MADSDRNTNDDDACSDESSRAVSTHVVLQKKGRGRPSLGKPTPVVMDAHEEAIARQMGVGVKSLGVRMALRAVYVMGVDKALDLARTYKQDVESSAPPCKLDDDSTAGQIQSGRSNE